MFLNDNYTVDGDSAEASHIPRTGVTSSTRL